MIFKKENESHLDYRKRVMDPVSHSFCAAKWYNVTIWLNMGMTASCHHPLAHKIPLDELETNPSALHNTSLKKTFRKMMIDGERPKECEYCWKIEDMGKDHISDRVFKTIIYKEEDVLELSKLPWQQDINPKTLELSFDRGCNLACAYCNASYSTSWAKDINLNGPYQNLGSTSHYNSNGRHENYGNDEGPYIEAFWKWWPELSQGLQELRITGGEPLLSSNTWKLLDYLQSNSQLKMNLAINTNLCVDQIKINKLITASKNISKLDIYTSAESYGKAQEYVRDGMDYHVWSKNLETVIEKANIRIMSVMMTINVFSLFHMVEFLEHMIEFKKKYGHEKPILSFNILRTPDFLSVTTLPHHMLLFFQEKLVQWYRKYSSRSDLLSEFELDSLKRFIDYLGEVDTPSLKSNNQIVRQQYLKNFIIQYNQRRNKSLHGIFPEEFIDWIENEVVS